MSKPILRVTEAGIFAILVDQPRTGWQHLGITEGGPLDAYSSIWANWLCGNDELLPCIEILGDQFVATVQGPCMLAITGAASGIKINGIRCDAWQSYSLDINDIIEISETRYGMRSYLAIHGGFVANAVFGSVTAVMRDKLGGHSGQGEKLLADDVLHGQYLAIPKHCKAPVLALPSISDTTSVTLRIVEGYQYRQFSSVQRAQLMMGSYTLSAQSNRMAAQFDGPSIVAPSGQMYSEGIAMGAVQVPPSGKPIVLMSDRQTIGGYPKLGSILSLDCDKLAQMIPGQTVTFDVITQVDAHNALALQRQRMTNLRNMIMCD